MASDFPASTAATTVKQAAQGNLETLWFKPIEDQGLDWIDWILKAPRILRQVTITQGGDFVAPDAAAVLVTALFPGYTDRVTIANSNAAGVTSKDWVRTYSINLACPANTNFQYSGSNNAGINFETAITWEVLPLYQDQQETPSSNAQGCGFLDFLKGECVHGISN